jgi:hypothetical protein
LNELDTLRQRLKEGPPIPVLCSGIHTESRRKCRMPAARLVFAGCVHEHVAPHFLCSGHAEEAEMNCTVCWHSGHECPLVEVPDPGIDVDEWLVDKIVPSDWTGIGPEEWREFVRKHLHDLIPEPLRTVAATCTTCESCTWNPGPDCGKQDHPYCPTCGHCAYRHEAAPEGTTP